LNEAAGMKTAPLYVIVIAIFCNLSACEVGRPDPQTAAAAAVAPAIGQDFKSVVRDKVPLYESGPEQISLPEAMLKKNAVVKVIRTEFGYSLIETQAGEMGWVDNEDLAKLEMSTAE
jgi:hypothetical protein